MHPPKRLLRSVHTAVMLMQDRMRSHLRRWLLVGCGPQLRGADFVPRDGGLRNRRSQHPIRSAGRVLAQLAPWPVPDMDRVLLDLWVAVCIRPGVGFLVPLRLEVSDRHDSHPCYSNFAVLGVVSARESAMAAAQRPIQRGGRRRPQGRDGQWNQNGRLVIIM